MTLDDEYRAQLTEQLRAQRVILHELEMQIATLGEMHAPVGIIVQRNNAKRTVQDLEQRLGIEQPTPPPQPRPRYVSPPPEPAWSFQAQYTARQVSERQRDITHQLNLLDIYRRNLKHYRNQAELMGAFAPPMVGHGIREAQQGIEKAKAALRSYGQAVEDLAGDE